MLPGAEPWACVFLNAALPSTFPRVEGLFLTGGMQETEPMGTAGPLALARNHLDDGENKPFFVLNRWGAQAAVVGTGRGKERGVWTVTDSCHTRVRIHGHMMMMQ